MIRFEGTKLLKRIGICKYWEKKMLKKGQKRGKKVGSLAILST